MTRFEVILETPTGSHCITCGPEEYIWDAAARQGIDLPAICHQGRCLTCAGMLLEGEVDERDADTYFAEDRAAGFVLLCRGKPRSRVRIQTHRQNEMRQFRTAHGLPAPYS
jgi:ferredoxin